MGAFFVSDTITLTRWLCETGNIVPKQTSCTSVKKNWRGFSEEGLGLLSCNFGALQARTALWQRSREDDRRNQNIRDLGQHQGAAAGHQLTRSPCFDLPRISSSNAAVIRFQIACASNQCAGRRFSSPSFTYECSEGIPEKRLGQFLDEALAWRTQASERGARKARGAPFHRGFRPA